MPKHTINIDGDIAQILRCATIKDNTLQLTGQLDRPTYQRVMKVLEAAGGKWNRKAGCHVFPQPVGEIFKEALATGGIVHKKKALQAFYTPEPAAARLVLAAEIEDGMLCLEPSAGNGQLIEAIQPVANVCIHAIEIDKTAIIELQKRFPGVQPTQGDFLAEKPVERYDRVVMNPPFTGGQDIDHVLHAFKFLRPGGVLVAIMSPGWQENQTARAAKFRNFVAGHGEIVDNLPPGTFHESGTEIRTVIIKLTK